MSVDGKRAIERIMEFDPAKVRITSTRSTMLKSIVYAYAPDTHHGFHRPGDLWLGAQVKHRAADEPAMEVPAGMPVFFVVREDRSSEANVIECIGISLGEGSLAYWDNDRSRVLSMSIDQYLEEWPDDRLLGWSEDIFGHRIFVGDRCASCGSTEHDTAGHSDPIDAIPTDLDEFRDDEDEVFAETLDTFQQELEAEEEAKMGIYIEGTIRLNDGTVRTFSIGEDGGWQQWGATTENLGKTVDVVETMARALLEEGLL